jgi:V/A-type H+-transporting ATPase subunit I
MKRIELSVLNRDADAVIEYLGRRGVMQFSAGEEGSGGEGPRGKGPGGEGGAGDAAGRNRIREKLEKLRAAAAGLGISLPEEPEENSVLPGEAEDALAEKICAAVSALSGGEHERGLEKRKVEETLNEARAFSSLDAPFADLDQLSYLTLRVGRLDPARLAETRQSLSDRAVIIPLEDGGDSGGRVLAAASRKGRFALDSELKKMSFTPITIPEGFKGVPGELLAGLENRLKNIGEELGRLEAEKEALKKEFGPGLRRLAAAYLMAGAVEDLKEKLRATRNVYLLSGWVPQDTVADLVRELQKCTGGRIGIRTFNPGEIPGVRAGTEKVPVSLEHGAFVKGFEGVVFSYGAPLYGTIDPTPFVAVFFALLFGIMFGDAGQGFVLLLAGILAGPRGLGALKGFRKYSSPLIAVGITSMLMGLLTGEVFTNEEALVKPTMALTGFLTGRPVERVLTLMPLAEKGGSVTKLFYFFGFTIGVGVILNSIGLALNIINLWLMKKYESALFSKTGVSGLLLFWYALFIALRCIFGGRFLWFDMIGLLLPVFCIFFGPLVWRLFAGERPVLAHGLMVFIMEGFVEILETASTYISNTVSFLRVGAFALSHAVLSYIVFRFSEEISGLTFPLGSVAALLIVIFGNAVIIVLEGMIVAIQVVRLQYYEFFSKFFVETGVEFAPFRFRRGAADKPV